MGGRMFLSLLLSEFLCWCGSYRIVVCALSIMRDDTIPSCLCTSRNRGCDWNRDWEVSNILLNCNLYFNHSSYMQCRLHPMFIIPISIWIPISCMFLVLYLVCLIFYVLYAACGVFSVLPLPSLGLLLNLVGCVAGLIGFFHVCHSCTV